MRFDATCDGVEVSTISVFVTNVCSNIGILMSRCHFEQL